MSHAALVKDGLLGYVVLLAVLLPLFTYAAIRTPPEPAMPPARPASRPPALPALPALPVLPAQASRTGWPPLAAPEQPDDAGYVARHATPRGGPPWGPAPRPPGLIR